MLFRSTLFKLAENGDLDFTDTISFNFKIELVETTPYKRLPESKFCSFFSVNLTR